MSKRVKVQDTVDKVVYPNCMHTACNSMSFVRAAAVHTKSKQMM